MIFQFDGNFAFSINKFSFSGIATTLHHVDEEIEEDDDAEVNQLTQNAAVAAASSSSASADSAYSSGQPSNRTISCPAVVAGSAGSKNSSGSGTPVRKISAHEFERGGLTKPLVTTVDGAPTFLSPHNSNADFANHHLIRKRSRNDIQVRKTTMNFFNKKFKHK